MSDSRLIAAAKCVSLLGFCVLVSCTYYLRGEVLSLSQIRFSADEIRSEHELEQVRETWPDRLKQHEVELKHYELQMEHYRKMLALYESDYDAYVERIKDKFQPPPLPSSPAAPRSPELVQELYQLNGQFRARKSQYFSTSQKLNWLACTAAVLLAGGLVYLLLFDLTGQRWHYLAMLGISFVFLIGPAFHSILTGIIGVLREPGLY